MSRRPPRSKRPPAPARAPAPVAAPVASDSASARLGAAGLLVAALLLVVALVFDPYAVESFRAPKLMAAELLGLASLVALAWERRAAEWPSLARFWRGSPALVAVAPLVLVATATALLSPHHAHVWRALPDLWIGAACLVGWSVALGAVRLARLLRVALGGALLLALLAIAQFHGSFQPFGFTDPNTTGRLEIVSLAGNVGDLGAGLVLPCLFAQVALWRARGRVRWAWGAALAVLLWALAVSQTLTALVALAVGTALLALGLLPRRQLAWGTAALAAVGIVVALAVPPLRSRLTEKVELAASGDWNDLFTGRFDGWRAAGWMVGERPLTGVGFGAFGAEFVPAKQALLVEGKRFYERQLNPVFVNAHDDYLEVAAECGWLGAAALAWGIWRLAGALRRRGGGVARAATAPASASDDSAEATTDLALARAGVGAIAVLALVYFPFHVALVAYPATLFLAWIVARVPEVAT